MHHIANDKHHRTTFFLVIGIFSRLIIIHAKYSCFYSLKFFLLRVYQRGYSSFPNPKAIHVKGACPEIIGNIYFFLNRCGHFPSNIYYHPLWNKMQIYVAYISFASNLRKQRLSLMVTTSFNFQEGFSLIFTIYRFWTYHFSHIKPSK